MKLAVESAQPIAQTARDLGVNENTRHTWMGKYHRAERQEKQVQDEHLYEARKRLRKDNARFKAEREMLKNRFVAPARHLWVEQLPPVGYRHAYGRSDRLLIGGSDPVKKPGPGNFADVRVVPP